MSRRLFTSEGGSESLPQNTDCMSCANQLMTGQRTARCEECQSKVHLECAEDWGDSCRMCRIEEEVLMFEGGAQWLLALLRKTLFCIILVLCGAIAFFHTNPNAFEWLSRALIMSSVASILVLLINASKEVKA